MTVPTTTTGTSTSTGTGSTGTGTSNEWASGALSSLRAYVSLHPQCADLAVPLWAIAITQHSAFWESTPSDSIKSLGDQKVGAFFPADSPPPPIWVDLPGLDILGGIELSAYLSEKTASDQAVKVVTRPRGSATAPRKEVLTGEQRAACVSALVRILEVYTEQIPVSTFKSTVAASHWIW